MSFGVTNQGFNAKRLADIREETLQAWRQKFGQGFSLPNESPEGQIKGLLDERISLLWELAEAVANSYNPNSAEGVQFDNILAINGLIRESATKSTIDSGRARGTLGTVIPVGTVISVLNNPTARFVTNANITISNVAINEIQAISFDVTPTSGKFNIVFPEGTTADINWNDAASTITTKCETVLGAGNIVVTGSIDSTTGLTLTYQGSLAATNRSEITISGNTLDAGGVVTITPSTTTNGDKPKSDLIELTSEDTGPIAAPAGSLTEIETPVSGLTSFTNENDAELGRDIETDQEAKLRRVQELQIAGAATPDAIRSDLLSVDNVTAVVVFENDTDITDLDGRPPHSIDVVVQGGDEQDIAETLWDTRSAGIETIGDITKTIVDSQGFNQTVKFSRPVEVDIYITINVTTNSQYPTNGDDLIKQAIINNYESTLNVGDNLIVFGSEPSLACSFLDVPGITDYEILVGTSSSPTLSDNIIIDPREIASLDTSRITINS